MSTSSEAIRRYIMIGAPVTSVRTPPLLSARLEDLGVRATVEAVHVEPQDLARFVRDMRADPTIDGLLVTMPHKRAVYALVDELAPPARQAGGVNTVKRLGERLLGAQFDGIALRSAVTAAGADLAAATVLLAGLGGAGLAIAHALSGRCGRLIVSETDPARLEAVLPALPDAQVLAPGQVPAADVLVNATPLGMAPDDPSPFPEEWIEEAGVVADIVADPNATRLAAQARAADTPLVTGRMMVQHQIAPIADWLLNEEIAQPS